MYPKMFGAEFLANLAIALGDDLMPGNEGSTFGAPPSDASITERILGPWASAARRVVGCPRSLSEPRSPMGTFGGVIAAVLLACSILVLGGCSSIGPGTVPRDRVGYLGAVAESWKEQTLLNIVRLRYGDAPVFLDVSSVISSYALQGQASASGEMSLDEPGSLVNLGANATYIDKPTISYTPLSGARFTKSLLSPIPPAAIFSLIQAGSPADFVLRITVRALNGVYNRSRQVGSPRPADPQFEPLLAAIRRIQISGVLGMRLEKRGSEESVLLVLPDKPTPEQERDIRFIAETLKLKPQNNEISLVFGSRQRSESELAILSRSMLEILIELAAGVEVPSEHVTEGRTLPAPTAKSDAAPSELPLVRIHSGPARPSAAFSAVNYRGTWYWINDGDFQAKRAFTFLIIFFSLAETGVTPQAPVITIPAN